MCKQPFSGIALKRDNRYLDWSDRYEDIIEWFNLPDNPDEIVRYEYAPREGRYDDLAAYRLKVKQDIVPDWWHDRADEIRSQMAKRVSRCIVADRRKILGGGPWILVDGAEIECAVNARIIGMYGSARVDVMRDSARVDVMRDSACVGIMYGLTYIGTIYNLTHIIVMHDSTQIGTMYGSAHVDVMRDSTRINTMHDSAHIAAMYESAYVEAMYNSAYISAMYDSARVGAMYDSTRIAHDYRIEED